MVIYQKVLTLHIFLNKNNHTLNIKAFRTLPFPAMISLLALLRVGGMRWPLFFFVVVVDVIV